MIGIANLKGRIYAKARRFAERIVQSAEMRQSVYLGNGMVLSRLYTGDMIYLDGSDISLTPHLALTGRWEDWVTKAFLTRIQPGMTVIDIGANCGYFTLLACQAVGPNGHVVAIDANPRMCELVSNSVSVNGYLPRSSVVNAAVMDRAGSIDFAIPKRFKGSATYLREGVDFSAFGDSHDVVKVPAGRLEDLVKGRRADVIKIDAEGAEPLILKGSAGYLADIPRLSLFMEFAPAFYGSSSGGAELLDQLGTFGFVARLITHDGAVVEASRDHLLSLPHCDLLLEKGRG